MEDLVMWIVLAGLRYFGSYSWRALLLGECAALLKMAGFAAFALKKLKKDGCIKHPIRNGTG